MKNTPRVRFKGFSEEWEEKELGSEVIFYSGLTYSPSNIVKLEGTLVLRSSNIHNGEIILNDTVYVANYCVNSPNVTIGDIIVVVRNGSRPLIGKHAIVKKDMPQTVIGAFMTGIKTSEYNFINATLDTNQFQNEIEKNLGATINQITTSAFKKMEFNFPEKQEQTKIGNFFKNIDTHIAKNQQKHEKLTQMKKALLEKVFPKASTKEPEIRFQGFSGEWEDYTLENCTSQIGDGLHGTPTYTENGNIYFINGNNLQDGKIIITPETKKVLSQAQSKDDNSLNSRTLLMSINGTIGNLAFYNDEKLMLGKSVAFLKIKNLNKYYLYIYLQTSPIKNYFENSLTGSTIKNLGLTAIRSANVLTPSTPEQAKIGELFRLLDKRIALQQEKIKKLKNMKHAFLEKMFV